MKTKLRLISMVLLLSMVFPILSGVIQPVFAADLENITVTYSASTATATISWKAVPNTVSGSIKYHVPSGTGNTASEVELAIDPARNNFSIPNIKKDIIYDFNLTLNDGAVDYTGFKYFTAGVTVNAKNVKQQSKEINGGGMETGIYPGMELSWNMPRVYESVSGVMVPASEATSMLNADQLNFKFKIQLDSMLKDVDVKMNPDGTYSAAVDGGQTCSVKDNSGKLSFYLVGRQDANTAMPDTGLPDTLPVGIPVTDTGYALPYPDLYPSKIYKIDILTMYEKTSSTSETIIDGSFSNTIESGYICSPIRFQITKDAENMLYVRAFLIRQGKGNGQDVDLQTLHYSVQKSYSNSPPNWIGAGSDEGVTDNGMGEETAIIDAIKGEENPVFYRVVVLDGKIESPVMEYRMQDDLTKPPVPRAILTNVELEYPPVSSAVKETSSKVTITWDYPGDALWEQIKTQDYYYHFTLSLAEEDIATPQRLMVDGQEKYFQVKYRDIQSVSARMLQVDRSGTKPRLKYVLDGYELFKGVGNTAGVTFDLPHEAEMPQGEPYPGYLLPNKTYYLQMYTSTEADRAEPYKPTMSDKSLITSFTTLSPASRDIPVPKYFELVDKKVIPDGTATPKEATVKLKFSNVDLDWADYTPQPNAGSDHIFYDLYMSTSPDITTFKLIDSTQNVFENKQHDVVFSDPYKDVANDKILWQDVTINRFTDHDNYLNNYNFGNSLSPNSTYYFMVKVRLVIDYDDQTKQSIASSLLPVTIPRGENYTPDDNAQRPQAPEDFGIALDKNGNPMVNGESVTFEWTIREPSAVYNLIATDKRVAPDDLLNTGSWILEDPTYRSFINSFGNKDNDGDIYNLILNPKATQLPPKFEILPGDKPGTTKCRYTIDTWLYPNKVYYFSLRSEDKGQSGAPKNSLWISIPVTTTLLESPTMLQVVNDCSLAFNWYGDQPVQNYQIKLKAVGEKDWILLTKSQYTIVQDSRYYNYARTTRDIKLKPDTEYNIQVVTRVGGVETAIDIVKYSSNDYYSTRDDYHEIDVRWQGVPIDPYTEFEIAIKTEDDTDYTVLDNREDLEQYTDISTHNYPYYIEKSLNNLNSNYFTYNARIKSVQITLPDGTKEHRPLKSNTKYYIKVRTKKSDPTNLEAISRSKYAGPVETRTEFNQDDYDDDDDNTDITVKFLDMIDKLEEEIYWEVNKGTGTLNKVYVKDDRVVNLLESQGDFSVKINLSQSPDYINSEEIYMSKDILNAMKSSNKSVIIQCRDMEYTIRPDTFDMENMEEFKEAVKYTGSKDVYLQLDNIQNTGVQPGVPENTSVASKMNVLSVQAVVSNKTSSAIKDLIKNKIYNDKSGLVQKKLAVLKNPNNTKTKGNTEEVNKYLLQLLEEIKSELSFYLEDTLNGTGYSNGTFIQKYSITKFSSPMNVKMSFKTNAPANPYVLYSGSGNWQKLSQNIKRDTGYLHYNITGAGKYAIFSGKDVTSAIADDNPAKQYIVKLAEKYDLAAVFSGAENSFNPNLSVTVKETILMYEVISESRVDSQKNVKDKAKAYGIDKIINTSNLNRNITRQETAAIVTKLYCQKSGADYNLLKTTYFKSIRDDQSIADKYAVPVYTCLQLNIMELDANSRFNPANTVTRAELAMAVEKMLEG